MARSSAESAIPWKAPGGKWGRAAATASGDVAINAIHAGSSYSAEQALKDFAVGFVGDLVANRIGELIEKYGVKAISQGLKRLGFDNESIKRTTKSATGNGNSSTAAKNTTILGNGQQKRVIPFAQKTNASTIDNGLTEAQYIKLSSKQKYKLNDGLLRQRINRGDTFRDIGKDNVSRDLDLLEAELLRLRDRGIFVETVSPTEILNTRGKH